MKILKPSRRSQGEQNHVSQGRADKKQLGDIALAEKVLDGCGVTEPVSSATKSPAATVSLSDFSDEFETAPLKQGNRLSGAGVSKTKADKPSKKSEYDTVMHRAIHLLSMREHSVKELQDKLSAKTDNIDVVLSVMDFLLSNDYVSDGRFTEAFVRSRANKGHGPIKIRAELRAKGVKSLLVDEHLNDSAAMWFDAALALYDKKYGDEPVLDYKSWSKRARFLQGRGFNMEHIQSVVPQVSD